MGMPVVRASRCVRARGECSTEVQGVFLSSRVWYPRSTSDWFVCPTSGRSGPGYGCLWTGLDQPDLLPGALRDLSVLYSI